MELNIENLYIENTNAIGLNNNNNNSTNSNNNNNLNFESQEQKQEISSNLLELLDLIMGIQTDDITTPNGWKMITTKRSNAILENNTQQAIPLNQSQEGIMAPVYPNTASNLNTSQNTIEKMGSMPIERHGHTTCLYKNKIILFGGTPDGSSGLNDLYFLFLDTFTWAEVKTKGPIPMGRYRHSAVIIEDKMYIFGGYRSKCLNDLHVLNLETLTWSEPNCIGEAPSARSSHSVCNVGKKMILFGGSGARYSNELFSLDTTTMKWTKHDVIGTPPSERWCHTMCSFGKKVITFGGSNDKRKDNKVYILDTDTMEWSQPSTSGICPSPRQLHTAVTIGESMIVFGGWGKHQELDDLYILNTRTMKWICPKIETQFNPCCRQLHSAWVYNGKMYVLGGYSKSKRMIDVYCFTPEQTVSSLRDLCIETIVENVNKYVPLFQYFPDEILYHIFSRLAQSGKSVPLQLDYLIKKSYLADHALITIKNAGPIEETLQYS